MSFLPLAYIHADRNELNQKHMMLQKNKVWWALICEFISLDGVWPIIRHRYVTNCINNNMTLPNSVQFSLISTKTKLNVNKKIKRIINSFYLSYFLFAMFSTHKHMALHRNLALYNFEIFASLVWPRNYGRFTPNAERRVPWCEKYFSTCTEDTTETDIMCLWQSLRPICIIWVFALTLYVNYSLFGWK